MPSGCLVLALAVALVAGPAQADPWRGGASVEIDSSYLRPHQRGETDARDHQASFGTSVRAYASPTAAYLGVGFDYRLGATSPGGFLYSFNVYPLGLAFVKANWASVALFAGAGVSGITDHLTFAVQLPVEARAELFLGRRALLTAALTGSWLTGEERQSGSSTLARADELCATAAIRWGRRYSMHGATGSSGYYLGAVYQEQLGSHMIGAVFGFSLHMFGEKP